MRKIAWGRHPPLLQPLLLVNVYMRHSCRGRAEEDHCWERVAEGRIARSYRTAR
jgi:hypothetical protein